MLNTMKSPRLQRILGYKRSKTSPSYYHSFLPSFLISSLSSAFLLPYLFIYFSLHMTDGWQSGRGTAAWSAVL